MTDEPSNYRHVCNLLMVHNPAWGEHTKYPRKLIDETRKRDEPLLPGVSSEKIIDIWINCVFAHSGLDDKRASTRIEFDQLVERFGIGKCEYALRISVWILSHQLIGLCKFAARPALDDWTENHGLKAGFTISSPFGRQMRERTADGTIIVRKASSKYFSEESLERRFVRILARGQFLGLKYFFDQLDASLEGKMLLAFRHEDILRILADFEWSFHPIEPNAIFKFPPATNSESFHVVEGLVGGNTRRDNVYSYDRGHFAASDQAVGFLNQQLNSLKRVFTEDEA